MTTKITKTKITNKLARVITSVYLAVNMPADTGNAKARASFYRLSAQNTREKIMRAYEILNEGGNAFTGVGAIHISEIKPTLQWLAKKINMPEIVNQTLGSVGKKEYSGDIDVVVDLDREEMIELANKLKKLLGEDNVRGAAANILIRVPIQGYDETKNDRGPRTGMVQIDFFPGDIDWLTTYYHSPGEESKLKGTHRNVFLTTIAEYVDRKASKEKDDFGRPAKVVRWRWSPRDGLIKIRAQSKQNPQGKTAKKQDVVYLSDPIRNPDLIVAKLFGDNTDTGVLNSVESLVDAVKASFPKKTAEAIFKDYAVRIDREGHREGFEFPPEIEKYWGNDETA